MTPLDGLSGWIMEHANEVLSYDVKNLISSPDRSIIVLKYLISSSDISRIEIRLAHPVKKANKVSINILFNLSILKFTNIHMNERGLI